MSISTDSRSFALVPLGAYRRWLFALVAMFAALIVFVPITVLISQSGGIDVYLEMFRKAGGSIRRSISYAVLGATLLTVLGFFTAYFVQTNDFGLGRTVDSLTIFLFALPSTVIGIGLISLWNTPLTNFVYATPVIIILGYLAKYTALSSRICMAQLGQIPRSMEEAAQVLGVGWLRRMVNILTPLAFRGLLIAWVVAYVFSLRDTGITMLVYPPGHETVPVRFFTLMANGSPKVIAALSVVMIIVTLVPAGILWMLQGAIAKKKVLV